ncbi:hypothetical protein FNF28_06389 [Cafeteria roenbergensis]|uniref:SREBP regulating gene protein n=2 Tax=Cafeteria roenbergensis TaxID=33653 RepID=A0A5A8CZQ6_CAFRO|nr:hypothetical protein FNF28_06389 [Cafeteria roenbergensis]
MATVDSTPPMAGRAALRLVAVLAAFIALLSELGPVSARRSVTARKRAMLGIQSRRRNCRSQVCGSIPVHEDDNCVNECVSPRCYQEVYGAEPLEPGEVDLVRWQQFSSCYSLEKRDLQRQYRQGGPDSASRADGSADEEADSEP